MHIDQGDLVLPSIPVELGILPHKIWQMQGRKPPQMPDQGDFEIWRDAQLPKVTGTWVQGR